MVFIKRYIHWVIHCCTNFWLEGKRAKVLHKYIIVQARFIWKSLKKLFFSFCTKNAFDIRWRCKSVVCIKLQSWSTESTYQILFAKTNSCLCEMNTHTHRHFHYLRYTLFEQNRTLCCFLTFYIQPFLIANYLELFGEQMP